MGRLKKRILVIDDQKPSLDILSVMLTHLCYDVKTSPDCFEALHLLENESFDLVIVDVIMPQIGGLLLMQAIRQEHPKLPILAISGYYDKVLDAIRGTDIRGILPKPIRLKKLRTTLNNIFSAKPQPRSQSPESRLTL